MTADEADVLATRAGLDLDSPGAEPGDAWSDEPPLELTQHFRGRAIVIPDARVLYIPVPKSGCSSIMWALAGVAGISRSQFENSRSIQPTPDLTIHDMEVWGPEHRLVTLDDGEIRDILYGEGWFRFTVVREPVRRLWSAWQSKILVQEPQMQRYFGGRSWWPESPETAADVMGAFRRFLGAVRSGMIEDDMPRLDTAMTNPHWDPQSMLLGDLGIHLDHIGRLERMSEIVDALNAHLASIGRTDATLPTANPSSLPAPPSITDAEDRDTMLRLYRQDFELFGYEPGLMDLESADHDAWAARIDELLPLVRAVIAHNQRFGSMYDYGRAVSGQLAKESVRLNNARSVADRRGTQIERMETAIERRTAQVETLRAEAEANTRKLKNAQSQHRQIREQVESLTLELESLEERRASFEQQAQTLEGRVKNLVDAKKERDGRIKELTDSTAALRANYGFMRAIADDNTSRMEAASATINDLESRLTWKMTKPFRRTTDFFRSLRLRGRIARMDQSSGHAARTSAVPKGRSK